MFQLVNVLAALNPGQRTERGTDDATQRDLRAAGVARRSSDPSDDRSGKQREDRHAGKVLKMVGDVGVTERVYIDESKRGRERDAEDQHCRERRA